MTTIHTKPQIRNLLKLKKFLDDQGSDYLKDDNVESFRCIYENAKKAGIIKSSKDVSDNIMKDKIYIAFSRDLYVMSVVYRFMSDRHLLIQLNHYLKQNNLLS